jgi:hypothetical protein
MDPCLLMFFALLVMAALMLIFLYQNAPPDARDTAARRRDRHFYLLVAGLLVVGGALVVVTPGAWVFEYMLRAAFPRMQLPHTELLEVEHRLGDALMIAGILAFGVDRYVKGQLLAEVARDVLSFAAGHALSDGLKGRVNDLLAVPYYRRNFQLRLVLTPLDRNGFVRVTMFTRYEVLSLTGEPRKYEVKTAIEESPWSDLEAGRLLGVDVSGPVSATFPARRMPQWRPGLGHIEFSTEVDLPARGGTPLIVETRRSAVYRESWSYLLDFVDTTEDVTIITETVVADPQLNFRWSVNIPQREVQPVQQAGRWPCPGVYLPGQFVRIIWTKEQADAQ